MTAPEASGTMSFLDHLEELRRRLIVCLAAIGVSFVICYLFSGPILTFLLKPLRENIFLGGDIVYITLTEPFLIYMKAAFFASIFLSSPVLFHQVWAFVSPGLHTHEKRWAWPFLIGGPALFVSGAAFAYIFLLPMTSRFLVEMGEGFRAAITLRSAFSFEFYFLVGMGVVFQLPIVIVVFARIGLVTPRFLLKNFRWALVIIFVLAGVLTPTADVVTQTVFAAPMIVLYLFGILLAYFVTPARVRAVHPRSDDENAATEGGLEDPKTSAETEEAKSP